MQFGNIKTINNMSDWEKEFKKYLSIKMKKAGFDIEPDSIQKIEIEKNLDLTLFTLHDLMTVYAFAITREDFEQAKEVSDEFERRKCKVTLELDEKHNSGVVNVFVEPNMSVPSLDMKLKIVGGNVMVEFEKEEL
jgi:hypothetical protein